MMNRVDHAIFLAIVMIGCFDMAVRIFGWAWKEIINASKPQAPRELTAIDIVQLQSHFAISRGETRRWLRETHYGDDWLDPVHTPLQEDGYSKEDEAFIAKPDNQ